MVLLLLVAAVIFAVVGALTVAKWLLIIAGILCVIAVVSAVINRDHRPLT